MTDVTIGEIPARLTQLAKQAHRFRWAVGAAVALQLILTIGILVNVLGITSDTNEDQERLVAPLQGQISTLQETNAVLADRNAELAEQLAVSEDLQDQATDHVERLALQVIELGGDPGIIRIEPSEPGD